MFSGIDCSPFLFLSPMADSAGTSRRASLRKRKNEEGTEAMDTEEIDTGKDAKTSRSGPAAIPFLQCSELIRQMTCLFMPWDKLKEFRKVNKTCDRAVTSSFQVYTTLNAGPLLKHYWPKFAAEDQVHMFDTLFSTNLELRRIISFMTLSNLVEVDLSCYATFNITQLARAFKDKPCVNVHTLKLEGVCVSKVTWDKLAELFPNVVHIRVERQYIFFHTKETMEGWPVKTLEERSLPPGVFEKHKALSDDGYFDEESVYMMRCLKHYFKKARSFFLK